MFKHKIYESTNHFDGIELVGRDFHFNCSSEASACFNYEMIQATMWGTIEYEDDAITATPEFMQILKMLSHEVLLHKFSTILDMDASACHSLKPSGFERQSNLTMEVKLIGDP